MSRGQNYPFGRESLIFRGSEPALGWCEAASTSDTPSLKLCLRQSDTTSQCEPNHSISGGISVKRQ